MTRLTIALMLGGTLIAACATDEAPNRRLEDLEQSYRGGVEDAREDVASGRAVLYVEDFRDRAPLRIDRETGLPIRGVVAICGTCGDSEAYGMAIAGYRAEIARALAAGELEGQSLRGKIPDRRRRGRSLVGALVNP